MIRLSIRQDQGEPRTISVDADTASIGRHDDNEVRLATKGVSGSHCRIRRTRHGYVIADLNSTNGTYVNRKRIGVVAQAVGPHDEIVVANYTVHIVVEAEAARPGAVGPAPPGPAQHPAHAAQHAAQTSPRNVGAARSPVPSGSAPHIAPGPARRLAPVAATPPGEAVPAGPRVPHHAAPSGPLAQAASPVDPEWAQAWARFDQLAYDWDVSDGDPARLLRGGELKDARGWLARSASREPGPTTVQRNFIHHSIQHARRRVLAGALGAFAVFAALFGGIVTARALAPRNADAEASDDEIAKAERKALRANSNRLAAQAGSVERDQPQTAALLAMEGLKLAKMAGEPRGSKAEVALRHALGKIRGRPLVGHQDEVQAAVTSTDGRWLATAGNDKSVRLWDLQRAGTPNARVLAGHGDWVHALAISSDSRWLASASQDLTARLWDLSAPDPNATARLLQGHKASVCCVAFSADSRWVITGSADGRARVWNASATERVVPATLSGHDERITTVALAPDASAAFATGIDGLVWVWPLVAGKRAGRASTRTGHENALLSMAVTPDGKTIVTGHTDGTARLWRSHGGRFSGDATGARGTRRCGDGDHDRSAGTLGRNGQRR